MAAPFSRWADLPSELLCHIGDQRLDLKGYTGARGACTAWRRALAPLSPTLLVLGAVDDERGCCHDKRTGCCRRPYALSLPARRSLELTAVVSGARVVGSSGTGGWLALSLVRSKCHTVFVLLNPVTAREIVLPPLIYDSHWLPKVSKVVFTPSRPSKDDFAAAAICDGERVAYVTAGARRWAVTDPIVSTATDHLTDVVIYNDDDNGKAAAVVVYCLTTCGDVHVLRLPDRRRLWNSAAAAANDVDEAEAPWLPPVLAPPKISVFPRRQDNSLVIHYTGPKARTKYQLYDEATDNSSLLSESQGPDLNFPATVEPLLSEANLPFNPATVFAPPCVILSSFFSAKNLVFCEGNLYQVWRNESCTFTLKLPVVGRCRVAEHEVLVLRYHPERRPCWKVVKDLGGHSFFVGRNNAVSMYAERVPGLKGNCVYWIGGRGRDQGMVFDMESGRSTPCKAPPPVGFSPGHPHSTICWYFL